MCNGIGIEERLAPTVGAQRLFAALAHVCLERRLDGSVEHQAHGKLLLGHARDESAAVQELAELVAGAGISCYQVGSLREARWRKLVWNLPYNGLSVVLGRDGWDTARIMADAETASLVRALMEEVIRVANADLSAHGATARIEPSWCDEMIRRTAVMGPYRTSTLRDWRAGLVRDREPHALGLRSWSHVAAPPHRHQGEIVAPHARPVQPRGRGQQRQLLLEAAARIGQQALPSGRQAERDRGQELGEVRFAVEDVATEDQTVRPARRRVAPLVQVVVRARLVG